MNPQQLDHSERVLPPHAPGMRIGLFGGTFDPPHEAHRAATMLALKRLRLDRIWWLVTPGNPLKNTAGLAPLNLPSSVPFHASQMFARNIFELLKPHVKEGKFTFNPNDEILGKMILK